MSSRSAAVTGRSPVLAQGGMVASSHPLATLAGVEVLAAGGNAADAAVAAAAVTWVTLPMMCGPGGDAFILVYEARSGKLTGIGGSGIVGAMATREYFVERGYRTMPLDGAPAVSVPGAVDALEQLSRRFGTKGWDELFAAAIRYAEEGFPVSAKLAEWFREGAPRIAGDPESARIYLREGRPPQHGEILVQPDLGRTLRILARGGAERFYRGDLGEAIARFMAERGGLFTADDLAAHRSDVYTPISTTYRGYEIHQTAPPSQGLIHLEAMNIVEGFDLGALGPDSDLAQHLMVEAKRLAFADRLRYAGDPRLVPFPLREILSKEHAARQRSRIDPDRALAGDLAGHAEGDTTYLCAVDRDGNAVSLIHSLSMLFGAGVTVPGTGILLNNRAGRGFTLEEGHPNCIAPGKRTMHTLNCYIVTRGGRPVIVGGTPGGDGQPQWNMQVLVNLIDFGMDPQEAVEAPRWTHTPGTDPATLGDPVTLAMESRFPASVVEGLRRRGHPVQVIGPYAAGGSAQVIRIDHERGVLWGGSDPRADGCALGR
ncbi:gamma-glutamyltransferase [Caldinitratiruptor microaerophilus]|uniref:Glutathione hydrolase proenzyme n=1 Tax=Caldinitratiruptor microaerophilus TaxID=671077 RepID=A0AA35CPJ4_9FIRM|nr:gamma-glutamyltransferase [Caldinitratiruptor microaerophilus]BDG61647.1 gamma-glutamyltransferase [Caldinitratiruptor microaerophilus]